MSGPRQLQVLVAVETVGVIPLFYHPDAGAAADVVAACVAGGAGVVEFTNRGERAIEVFEAVRERIAAPDLVLGAGSVVDAPTAARYIAAGADYIVSPYLVKAVARLCRRRRVAYIPGAATPTEIARAEAAGAELVKLFPACVVGPAFVRQHLGPSPTSRLVPTGGIDASETAVTAWIRAGAAAVGIGSQLIPAGGPTPRELERLPGRLQAVRAWIAAARAAG